MDCLYTNTIIYRRAFNKENSLSRHRLVLYDLQESKRNDLMHSQNLLEPETSTIRLSNSTLLHAFPRPAFPTACLSTPGLPHSVCYMGKEMASNHETRNDNRTLESKLLLPLFRLFSNRSGANGGISTEE